MIETVVTEILKHSIIYTITYSFRI
jgi:hypothetical protein